MATGDTLIKYGTADQAITITLASLANAAARESTAIDSSSSGFFDIIVDFQFILAAGAASDGVYLWLYTAQAASPGYEQNATGSDAAITMRTNPSFTLLGVIPTATNGATYRKTFSILRAFGAVPPKWGIIVENRSGFAFTSTEGNHVHVYRGLYANTSA